MRGRWPPVWHLALVFLAALAVRVLTALPLEQPGYMDAYYYHHVAANLHAGRGFVEALIWNYLEEPMAIVHPSNLYWMPLPSMMAWLGFAAAGVSYRAAQIPFVLLSALVPAIGFAVCYRLFGKMSHAVVAAALGAFGGFYMVYWVAIDNFAPFAVAGALALVCAGRGLEEDGPGWWGAAGALAGLGHLARADGALLLVAALGAAALDAGLRRREGRPIGKAWRGGAVAVAGYLAVMAPWLYRNWQVAGTPLPAAGAKTIFLRDYEGLFSYGRELTLGNYLEWGLGPIVLSKLQAAAHNLTVILGGLFFYLAPFSAIGLWSVRRRRELWPFAIYAACLYLAMTLVFTFPSMRGSMLHSATALMPFLYAGVPAGIRTMVRFVANRRKTWDEKVAGRFFEISFAGLAVALGLFSYSQSVFLPDLSESSRPVWNRRSLIFVEIGRWLEREGRSGPPVMVQDPPAYQYMVGRPAIVVPSEAPEVVVEICRRYGARYLILGPGHPSPLTPLYEGEEHHPDLAPLWTFGTDPEKPFVLFEVRAP